MKILKIPDFLFIYIPKFLKIFASLRDLLSFLESDHMLACYLYSVIEEFRTKLEDEAIKADDDVSILLKDLIKRIDDRLKKSL